MNQFKASAILYALLLAQSVAAQTTPPSDGFIGACRGQGCGDCAVVTDSSEGFPNCLIYDSAATLGQDYATADGKGYDVWWNSGTPNPSCKIVVRTPASTDIPQCGYFLTAWDQAGCYFTSIQRSFMLQYCCGQGDCDAAAPAASIAEAHTQALQGNTTVVSLKFDNLAARGESGSHNIEGIGEVTWKRSDHATARRSEVPNLLPRQSDCKFIPTSDRITEGGRQVKATQTQICNSPGGCSQTITVTVTEGQSINPMLTGNFFMIISAAVGYTFTESKSFAVGTTYTQEQGTTGYLSFIPTLNCWDGKLERCAQKVGDDISQIDPNQIFHACTPALLPNGELDGTFSFVFV